VSQPLGCWGRLIPFFGVDAATLLSLDSSPSPFLSRSLDTPRISSFGEPLVLRSQKGALLASFIIGHSLGVFLFRRHPDLPDRRFFSILASLVSLTYCLFFFSPEAPFPEISRRY